MNLIVLAIIVGGCTAAGFIVGIATGICRTTKRYERLLDMLKCTIDTTNTD